MCEDRASGARADAVAVHQQSGGRGRHWPFSVARDAVGRRRATGGRAGAADLGSVVPHSGGAHRSGAGLLLRPVGGLGVDPRRRVRGRPPSLGGRATDRRSTASFPRGGDGGPTAPPPWTGLSPPFGPLDAAMDMVIGRPRTGLSRSRQASSGPRTTRGASLPRSTSTRLSSLAINTSSTRHSAPKTWRQRPSSPATVLTPEETRSTFDR